MIVHVMAHSIFTRPFIEFVHTGFDWRDHRFLIFGGVGQESVDLPPLAGVVDRGETFSSRASTAKLFNFLRRETAGAERIVIHGLFDHRIALFFFLHPRRARRSCWVIWGADLYGYRELRRTKLLGAADRIVRGRLFQNLDFVVALAPGDVDILNEAYGLSKTWLPGQYVNAVAEEHLSGLAPRVPDPARPLRLLVGNSASSLNNHEEVLQRLARFRHKAIEVIVPLSYGDPDYASHVRGVGLSLLGDRFISLDEFLPPRKYAELLSTLDVAIFNHEQQLALGNFAALAYLGVKIFARNQGSGARYIRDDLGIPLFDVESLSSLGYNELGLMDPETRTQAREAGRQFYDESSRRILWERIFDRPFA